MDVKSNEILAVRELLKAFTDLAGAVITAAALHAQGGTAQAITGRHAGLLRLDGHAGIAAANRHRARGPRRALKLRQTA